MKIRENGQSPAEQQRQKLNLLLSLQLSEVARPGRTLQQLIHEAAGEAQSNGLTPEKLREILDE